MLKLHPEVLVKNGKSEFVVLPGPRVPRRGGHPA